MLQKRRKIYREIQHSIILV